LSIVWYSKKIREHNVSETGSVSVLSFRNVVFSAFLEYQTMDKVQKHSNSECYTPSSEPIRIYLKSFALIIPCVQIPVTCGFLKLDDKCTKDRTPRSESILFASTSHQLLMIDAKAVSESWIPTSREGFVVVVVVVVVVVQCVLPV
jgi:hypothetical protein